MQKLCSAMYASKHFLEYYFSTLAVVFVSFSPHIPSAKKGMMLYIERRKTQRYYNDCKSLTCLLDQGPQLPHSRGSLSAKGMSISLYFCFCLSP
jgi:hypothetical protein